MLDPKILFQNNRIEVIEIGERLGLRQKNPSVLILPYTLDAEGNPESLGLVAEPSDFKEGGMSVTVISGSPDEADLDILETAKRELLEESGFSVDDVNRWDFLGSIKTYKMIINGNPAFGVNVTGIVGGEKTGDGSEFERNSKFSFYPISQALNFDDALISCLFIKMFQNNFLK